MSKTFRGTITNWRVAGTRVEGYITCEADEDRGYAGFFPGRTTPIYTSTIVKISEDRSKLETENSIYSLEDEWDSDL